MQQGGGLVPPSGLPALKCSVVSSSGRPEPEPCGVCPPQPLLTQGHNLRSSAGFQALQSPFGGYWLPDWVQWGTREEPWLNCSLQYISVALGVMALRGHWEFVPKPLFFSPLVAPEPLPALNLGLPGGIKV